MNGKKGKTGRKRSYPQTVDATFADASIEEQIALMGELVERVADQIVDLPDDALSFRPANTYFSVAKLVLHLAESEYGQIERVATNMHEDGDEGVDVDGETTATTPPLDPAVGQRLAHGRINDGTDVPAELASAALLVDTIRSVHRNYTVPVCRTVQNADARLPSVSRFHTWRELLTHLNWHWTYHSGQIGLLRLQWGDDYVWTMRPREDV